ncbi:helix-turn-helix domain-containing protein [Streptomyces flaveolus]|uniref:helix-turn-helix domain-containing protein n=1 Tax=Streptomyces flaveolus TaxID=67297 RepID=UPI00380D95C4
MLTLAEVCEELANSRSTFYDWRAKRRAPRCIKLPNGDLRIRRSDLEIHEQCDLKGREEGETRIVPGHPALTRILRQHIQDEQLKPGDLFQGESGGILAGSVIRRAWRGARKAVLPPHVFESPTGRRVYDNRHTRLTKWLNDGIPPAQVAEWAGNSVAVLLATYARCVDGQLPDLKRRLEAAGDLPEAPGPG